MKTILLSISLSLSLYSFGIDLKSIQGEWISEKYAYLKIENDDIVYEYGWFWTKAELTDHFAGRYDSTAGIFKDFLTHTRYVENRGKIAIKGDSLFIEREKVNWQYPNRTMRNLVVKLENDKLMIKDITAKKDGWLTFKRLGMEKNIPQKFILKTETYSIQCTGKPKIIQAPRWRGGYTIELTLIDSELVATCTESGLKDTLSVSSPTLERIKTLLGHIPNELPEAFGGFIHDGHPSKLSIESALLTKNINSYKVPHVVLELKNILCNIYRKFVKE